MNNEKMLSYMWELVSELGEETKNAVKMQLKDGKPWARDYASDASTIAKIILELQDDIKTEEAKKSGRCNAKRAADKIIEQLNADTSRGAFLDEEGRQVIGGMYLVVRLKESLPVKVTLEKDFTPPPYEKIITGASKNTGGRGSLPTRSELVALIKQKRAEHKGQKGFTPVFDFGECSPAVNADYLLYMIDLLGEKSDVIFDFVRPQVGAIYFRSNKGDGVLMPVRK